MHNRTPSNNRPQNDHPQREVTKPVTYTKQTDESSQDSQMIGTIYPVDNRPIPDAKLEKIVGMSEPLAYRLGAQHYIDAKKRGEILPPPNAPCQDTKPRQRVNQNQRANLMKTM